MRRISRLLCCFFLVLANFSVNAQSLDCQQHHCLAVVDAGSTGSRLHIYSYDTDKSQTPVNITEKWSKKVKPGFASLDANQKTVDTYLTNLFTDAPDKSMPVYFYATAGMRLLPQPQQQHLYTNLQNWFQSQSQWQLIRSKTITGKEEGLFGWLAVNYQLGTLSDGEKEGVGVMDMGGASVQIVFPTPNNVSSASENIQQLDLYGRHFSLFIHSFLGLGQTEVSHQFFDSTACFMNDYEMPDGRQAQGDARACEAEISPLMNSVHKVNGLVEPLIRANPVPAWYVMGGVVDLVKSKPFNFSNNQFNNQELLEQADNAVCRQSWSSMSAQYPGNDYLYGYCLFPAYYYALMVDGYGIQAQTSINFMNTNQNGDWTLGVVLYPQA